MNAGTTARYLAWFEAHKNVMKAFAQGEEIQVKNFDGAWQDCPNPVWVMDTEYRIKPQPRTVYIVERRWAGCDNKWERHKTTFVKTEAEQLVHNSTANARSPSFYDWRISEFVEVTRDGQG